MLLFVNAKLAIEKLNNRSVQCNDMNWEIDEKDELKIYISKHQKTGYRLYD